jgi:hypothetical protein
VPSGFRPALAAGNREGRLCLGCDYFIVNRAGWEVKPMELATKTVGQNRLAGRRRPAMLRTPKDMNGSPSLTDFDTFNRHATIYFYVPGRNWLLTTLIASVTLFFINIVLMGFFLFHLFRT